MTDFDAEAKHEMIQSLVQGSESDAAISCRYEWFLIAGLLVILHSGCWSPPSAETKSAEEKHQVPQVFFDVSSLV